MAIFKCISLDEKREMTSREFKRWLKSLDSDKDGRLSTEELTDAIRGNGGRFARWKGKRGVRSADANGDGFVDEAEVDKLMAFAEKHLGVKIISP